LVIGFGNIYRRDDGVAVAVVNAVRDRLGQPPLEIDEDGFDTLGQDIDSVLLHQLVPELAEVVADYDLIVFVDAHVGSIPEDLREEELTACYKSATVSHQLHPCTLLALIQELYDLTPRGVLLSIRGYDFEFGEGLSEKTAALVPAAVERVLALPSEPSCIEDG
jgi:hydrogenase maturation protease